MLRFEVDKHRLMIIFGKKCIFSYKKNHQTSYSKLCALFFVFNNFHLTSIFQTVSKFTFLIKK